MTFFAYPWALLLYIPFIALVIYAWRKPLPSIRVSTAKPFLAVSSGNRPSSFRLPFMIFTIALALLICALARPRQGSEQVVIKAKGIDIMLAIDLSGSMESVDVSPGVTTEKQLYDLIKAEKVKGRLETAKQEIGKFIAKRPNDRIGLVGFAELAYNICPPTLDHAWLIANMTRLAPGVIGDRTNIASPIASSVSRLEKSDSKRRVMVLFTDGSNNIDDRITPRQAAKLAKRSDVVIYTVGIGSDNACVLREGFGGLSFVPVKGAFDEKLLKDIAEYSDGKYYKAYDANGLENVMNEINRMEKTVIEQPKYIDYKEFAPTLIAMALALVLFSFLLENTVMLRVP
jgi:Ca-activated chloride channel family protein